MRDSTVGTARSQLRTVGLPSEHGGWGLTLEPGILGMLVAPSWAGLWLALSALLAFVARTPLKLALVDRRRGRSLERTRLATRLAAVEIALIAGLALVVAMTSRQGWWWTPLIVAGPLLAVELWFDVRSHGRRLLPELAGAGAIGAVATMIVLSAGEPWRLAVGLWLVVAARSASSVPFVRGQVMRLHGRSSSASVTTVGDLVGLAAGLMAVMLDSRLVVGVIALIVLMLFQRLAAKGRPRPAIQLGFSQLAAGLVFVVIAALGVVAQ